jgi:hypothetical protein
MEYLKKNSLKREEKDWKLLLISMYKFCYSNTLGCNNIVIKVTGHGLVAHQPPVYGSQGLIFQG